jgi:hypothetical protein
MLDRLTVSALLKAVILTTSFCIVTAVSLSAWGSWTRVQQTNGIAAIADASANVFKAMHNLRTDQSTTFRLLNAEPPLGSDIEKYVRGLRNAEMPAMASALALLPSIEFPQHAALVSELDRLFKLLTALQKEFWDTVDKPKASRRPELSKEYFDATAGLLQTLDKLPSTPSRELAALSAR